MGDPSPAMTLSHLTQPQLGPEGWGHQRTSSHPKELTEQDMESSHLQGCPPRTSQCVIFPPWVLAHPGSRATFQLEEETAFPSVCSASTPLGACPLYPTQRSEVQLSLFEA